jgi:hypothetical protein
VQQKTHTTLDQLRVELTLEGNVNDFTVDKQTSFLDDVARELDLSPSALCISSIRAGSIIVDLTISLPISSPGQENSLKNPPIILLSSVSQLAAKSLGGFACRGVVAQVLTSVETSVISSLPGAELNSMSAGEPGKSMARMWLPSEDSGFGSECDNHTNHAVKTWPAATRATSVGESSNFSAREGSDLCQNVPVNFADFSTPAEDSAVSVPPRAHRNTKTSRTEADCLSTETTGPRAATNLATKNTPLPRRRSSLSGTRHAFLEEDILGEISLHVSACLDDTRAMLARDGAGEHVEAINDLSACSLESVDSLAVLMRGVTDADLARLTQSDYEEFLGSSAASPAPTKTTVSNATSPSMKYIPAATSPMRLADPPQLSPPLSPIVQTPLPFPILSPAHPNTASNATETNFSENVGAAPDRVVITAMEHPRNSATGSEIAAATTSNALPVTVVGNGTNGPDLTQRRAAWLGYLVALGSCVVKLPQFVQILRSGRSTGLQASMFAAELVSQTTSILYHCSIRASFDTYGESVALGAGNVAILLAMALVSSNAAERAQALFALLPAPLAAMILSRSPQALAFAQGSLSVPLYLLSRVPQILANFRARSTGQLSALTFASLFMGSLVRVFTTKAKLGNDWLLQCGFGLSMLCNATLVGQVMWYNRF